LSEDICPQDSLSRAPQATVIVVEDSEVFRRFVCSSLRNKPGLQIICEASDGREGVQKCEELQPDLVILDIGLPTLNGIEAARRDPPAFAQIANSLSKPGDLTRRNRGGSGNRSSGFRQQIECGCGTDLWRGGGSPQ
jgi:hypothetical protein